MSKVYMQNSFMYKKLCRIKQVKNKHQNIDSEITLLKSGNRPRVIVFYRFFSVMFSSVS